MRVSMGYGRSRVELEADAAHVIAGGHPGGPDVADPAAAVRAALEAPFGYPPLRRALTPDDRVTIVVDESLPDLAALLVPVLQHLGSAGVAPDAVTILVPPSATGQPWVEGLPDEFEEVHVEIHDPSDRKRLRYLATTRRGRRLYLNKSAVDADQLVVLSGRRFDPVLGHGGAEGSIFPALSDAETLAAVTAHGRLAVPGAESWPAEKEAVEAAWLVGAPFFVQVIEGAGDGVAGVVAGSTDATAEGRRLLDERWLRRVAAAAEVVVAGLSGDPARHTFADLAAAAANAARVVRPGGRIVLLSEVASGPGPEFDVLRGAEDPGEVAARLGQNPPLDQLALARWAEAAGHARIALLSGLDAEEVEDLFATPLAAADRAQRLLDAGGESLFLEDAHKSVAVLTED